MNFVEVWVERPKPKLLRFDCTLSSDAHTVPRFTRQNVAGLIYWLFEFDPETGPEEGGSTFPYLLDDLMEMLHGGVFSIAYPTDHGKSTLVDADTVCSLLLWPEETLNIIIKRAVETAIASAQACAFKLLRASDHFPYARPLCRWDVQTGLPQVKAGYFIEGCRLRNLGNRDRSVYPAGIASASVQGMRGRSKLDDLEDENTLKSEAKTDTLRKQVNNSIRNLQQAGPGVVPLWAVLGTAQGAQSVVLVVDEDLSGQGMVFRSIRRPQVIEDGPFKGQFLFPARQVKSKMQQGLMDPAAYDIAYNLKVPGAGRFDAEHALRTVLDPRLPLFANEGQFQEYLYNRLIEDGSRHGQGDYSGDIQREAHRMVTEELALYVGWDPATVGTYAMSLLAMLPRTRWLLRLAVDSKTSDEQADDILQWQELFPSVTVVVERDGTQDAFIDILRLKGPGTMIVPHQTHGFNKNTRHAGIPAMMGEMLVPNCWHFPYVPEDYCTDYLARLLREVRRWGPTDHPHAIPALWFPWYFDRSTRMGEEPARRRDGDNVEVFDVVLQSRRPMRDVAPTSLEPRTASQESWARRWPSLRQT